MYLYNIYIYISKCMIKESKQCTYYYVHNMIFMYNMIYNSTIFIYIYILQECIYIYIYISLPKRSFKGFLLNFLMAGQCHSPRLVPPGASPLVPPSKYPKLKVPPTFPKFAKSSFRLRF